MPTISQLNARKPENVIASNEAMGKLVTLATKNDFGAKNSYNFEQGVGEFARDFSLQKKPFGTYNINGNIVYFVSERDLSPEQSLLFNKVRTIKTEAPGVVALATGKIVNIASEREPVYEVVRRDHEEN